MQVQTSLGRWTHSAAPPPAPPGNSAGVWTFSFYSRRQTETSLPSHFSSPCSTFFHLTATSSTLCLFSSAQSQTPAQLQHLPTMDSLTILAMAAEAVQRSESLELEREFTVRRPRSSDIPLLSHVEKSAAEIFRSVKLDFLADGETLDPYTLVAIANAGYLWIAADRFDQPIGFLGGNYLNGNFHIIELSVAKQYQGLGIGRALMTTMVQQVRLEGYRSITLTTFRDLPWNGPWYAKMGFVEVKVQEMGRDFEELVESEAQHGLDPKRRCLMRLVI